MNGRGVMGGMVGEYEMGEMAVRMGWMKDRDDESGTGWDLWDH